MWPFRGRVSKSRQVVVRASYDAAKTTYENRNHWANADNFSALAAITPQVRRTLRSRARYEVANNSYCAGIVQTIANDTIGTGPVLQMLTNSATANRIIEAEFEAWASSVGLAAKLRTMRMARAQDGEAFAMLVSNPGIAGPVKLDVQLVEADQVAAPAITVDLNDYPADGIKYDAYGNPVSYTLLTTHPGDPVSDASSARTIPAASMIHWFRTDRAGQVRGIPDITPAIPLFAQLRRYTLAVISAAETAANFGVIMETTAPAGGEAAEVDPTTEMELSRNSAIFSPEGWKATQLKAEQPTTTYAQFKREILGEIARCLNIPYNVAAADSSSYNFASGQLDHQTYYRSLRVDQTHLETVVLDRILAAWLEEAQRVLDELPTLDEIGHQWFWDGREVGNPIDLANATQVRLTAKTTTLLTEYAKVGKDWETEVQQIAKEDALLKKLGLTTAQATPAPFAKPQEPQNVKQEDSESDTSEEADDED